MTLFTCEVPGQPIPQSRARTTRNGTFYGKRATAHRKTLHWLFAAAHGGRGYLQSPLSIVVDIAGARADSDADNHAKMVLDALVDAGVIVSDNVCTVRELVVRVIEGAPRTVVTITGAL